MDVAVSELRAHLSGFLARAEQGEEIVVTDRGRPVARLVSPGYQSLLERLAAEGVLTRPSDAPAPPASAHRRAAARASVVDLVSSQRD